MAAESATAVVVVLAPVADPLGLIVTYLPWLLSAITIWMTLLAGSLHPKAWLVGLANQVLWMVWAVSAEAWGFIPLNLALWVVYWRNHRKWKAAR